MLTKKVVEVQMEEVYTKTMKEDYSAKLLLDQKHFGAVAYAKSLQWIHLFALCRLQKMVLMFGSR